MQSKKSFEIALFIIVCILLNYAGKLLTDLLTLPVWLDSFGTVLTAYVFGPVCGAVVGAAVNIIYSMRSPVSLFYGLTNIAVGITVGICTRKGFLKSNFGIMSAVFLVAIFSVAISTPLNYLLADGSTSNVWGDGVIQMLQELGMNSALSHIIGEFYLDFLDKAATMLMLVLALKLYRKYKPGAEKKKRSGKTLFIGLLALLSGVLLPTASAQAAEISGRRNGYNFHEYVQTVYDGDDGLLGGTANDVIQTKDGVLWIGTNGGLYRYSGSTFQWMDRFASVKTVNCLYTDAAGRLWIGTNDNGLSICIGQEVSNVVNRENGLPSNSVRCITEDAEGYYYVGTSDGMVVMTLSGGLSVHTVIPEIVHAVSASADEDGNVAAVTENGVLYLVRDAGVIEEKISEIKGGAYRCCAFDKSGNLYVGTSADTVEVYQIEEGALHRVSVLDCGGLSEICSLNFSEDGILFLCAENGAGYMDSMGIIYSIDTDSFDSAINHMLIDYQGNFWFSSSRLGLLRMCPSVFSKVYEGGLSGHTANAVIRWHGCLYVGTDGGLKVSGNSFFSSAVKTLETDLDGIPVRCLMADFQDNLWICTDGRGIYEITKDGEIQNYASQSGTLGDVFRCVTEMKDGTIAAAGDSGITFLRDGQIVDTTGAAEGLRSCEILSLHESADGSLLAGTDGSGVAVIRDGVVTDTLTLENGLSSEVVRRIVPDSSGGLFFVTENGLCYSSDGTRVRLLNNFPHNNNYDVIQGQNGELFVPGTAGIYVVDKAELLAGGPVTYALLDSKQGLMINLTPDAWSYLDENDNLYLPGNTGVVSVNLHQYTISTRSYRMLLTDIVVDGEAVPVEKGESILISRDAVKIEIAPEIINYSLSDPTIRVYLEGFDTEPAEMPHSELSSVSYTNLPSGEYTFHLAALDDRTGSVIAENIYRISKEKEIHDNWWFRLYMVLETVLIVVYLTWLFFRTQVQKTIRMHNMEMEWAKRQLQMGNETIMTIAQAVDAKDERTNQHSLRVSEYSVLIAKRLGFSDGACEDLRKIAMLHDIGKIGIPDRVLNKPAPLTDEEYAIMKSHVKRGAEILKNFTLIDHVADGALYHHERYDGRGYVNGLKGEEIPLNARIIGIADAFDAMTANRVYRQKLDLSFVVEELKKGSGTQFDPRLVEIMLSLIEDGTIDVKRIYEEKQEGKKDEG